MNQPNILIIVLDGLRSDRVPLCPELCKILLKGYFFDTMITAAPYTLASLHSVSTGLYPYKHGVNAYFNMFKFKGDMCKPLAAYLKEQGYCTFANVVNESLLPKQGFEQITVHDEHRVDLLKLHKECITNLCEKKFFMVLQYTYLHTQNVINVGKKYTDFSPEFFDDYPKNVARYNSYLPSVDAYCSGMYEHLASLDILKNTVLIILSDHGSSNGERKGEKMYGSFTYDYTVRVFCSFLWPTANATNNTKSRRISVQTRTIDIMPTILDYLKIPPDESYLPPQGTSLLPVIDGEEKKDRTAFAETGGLYGLWPSPKEHNVFCIREPPWKIIFNATPGTWELYNLENDPLEKNNVIGENKEHADILKKKMAVKLQACGIPQSSAELT